MFISNDKLVFKQSTFKVNAINLSPADFLIRKSSWTDKLKRVFGLKVIQLNTNSKYVFTGTSMNQSVKNLISVVSQQIKDQHIEFVKYEARSKQLTLAIRDIIADKRKVNEILNIDSLHH